MFQTVLGSNPTSTYWVTSGKSLKCSALVSALVKGACISLKKKIPPPKKNSNNQLETYLIFNSNFVFFKFKSNLLIHCFKHPTSLSSLNVYLFFFFFFFFFRAAPTAYGVPQLGVESELQLPACTTATAIPDPSHICTICHRLWQCQIFNPLSKAREQTCILMDLRVLYPLSHDGNSHLSSTCADGNYAAAAVTLDPLHYPTVPGGGSNPCPSAAEMPPILCATAGIPFYGRRIIPLYGYCPLGCSVPPLMAFLVASPFWLLE